jgi:hypothetical protein
MKNNEMNVVRTNAADESCFENKISVLNENGWRIKEE